MSPRATLTAAQATAVAATLKNGRANKIPSIAWAIKCYLGEGYDVGGCTQAAEKLARSHGRFDRDDAGFRF